MPNWCSNKAVVEFPTEEAKQEFMSIANLTDFKLFQYVRPRPCSEDENWYEWNTENWDTKWDAHDLEITEISDKSIEITFQTAWSPPLSVYMYWEFNANVKITAVYNECGVDFVGFYLNNAYEEAQWSSLYELPEDYDPEDDDYCLQHDMHHDSREEYFRYTTGLSGCGMPFGG